MSDRAEIEQLIRRMYAARVAGDIETLGMIFAENARFQMAGSPDASPLAMTVDGHAGIMAQMQTHIDSFELGDFTILDMVIDGDKAAVRWRATIHYTTTGRSFSTQLADFISVANREVVSFVEFIDTALAVEVIGAG
jgi:ketosteroid isomerase-like protein